MRSITVVSALMVLVLGLGVVAWGEDGSQDRVATLESQVELLEAQVEYLAARENVLSAYLLDAETRGAALERNLSRSRAEGFTMGAISSTSRELLLGGLEAYAGDIAKDLPTLTREQTDLLRRIQNLKRRR